MSENIKIDGKQGRLQQIASFLVEPKLLFQNYGKLLIKMIS